MKFLGFILEKCMGFTCTGLAVYLWVAYADQWLPFGISMQTPVLLTIWAYLGLPIVAILVSLGLYLLFREEMEKKEKNAAKESE